ncbi:MAG TPA: hypothetical protein VND96_05945 [Candidatus Micrarchaeaceae archaeon]|nr:hypothetical protein [Candidatus Micrarchaeaceae archaeon]
MSNRSRYIVVEHRSPSELARTHKVSRSWIYKLLERFEKGGYGSSVATIWRILKRKGLVTPQLQKRPKSSFIRFAAKLPNET